MDEKEFLDIRDMCDFFGWGEDKIRKEVKLNRLPKPIRRGRKNVWFKESARKAMDRFQAATEKNIKASAFQ